MTNQYSGPAATIPKLRRVVAAFDFDGTISTCDSLQRFVRATVGTRRYYSAVLRVGLFLLAVPFCGKARGYAKRRFLQAVFGKFPAAYIKDAAQHFQAELSQLIRPEMLSRVREHQKRGHHVVLVSASPSVYLALWAASVGIEDVLSTEIDLGSSVYSGRWLTPNCWGPEKMRRLNAWWGSAPPDVMYAYGDSRGDKEMAAAATYSWIRGRDQALPPLLD